nr:hypothetical protein RU989_pgp121 [Laurencia obtusa]WMP12890.1 hypothetical protein [Laurencia obtusa]
MAQEKPQVSYCIMNELINNFLELIDPNVYYIFKHMIVIV